MTDNIIPGIIKQRHEYYLVHGCNETAKKFGVSRQCLYSQFKKYNLQIQEAANKKEDRENKMAQIVEKYRAGIRAKDICKELKVSLCYVYRIVEANTIKKQPHASKKFEPSPKDKLILNALKSKNTVEAAKEFGVTPGRISQVKNRWGKAELR